jgi:hypothetical protein
MVDRLGIVPYKLQVMNLACRLTVRQGCKPSPERRLEFRFLFTEFHHFCAIASMQVVSPTSNSHSNFLGLLELSCQEFHIPHFVHFIIFAQLVGNTPTR